MTGDGKPGREVMTKDYVCALDAMDRVGEEKAKLLIRHLAANGGHCGTAKPDLG